MSIKVVILCGGFGTRLKEETEFRPKPMIEIGGMPILWHIMKTYAYYGFNEFILCLGYKADLIKQYFYNYEMLANDFTIELGTKNITVHSNHSEKGWKIFLINTGLSAMTGARVKRIEKYIDTDTFMLTYGDGLTNVNLKSVLDFHLNHGKIGTITGVHPPSKYGELTIYQDQVLSFNEKQEKQNNSINGGYFVLNRKFFSFLRDDDSCILEKEPLENLAAAGELKVFHHQGFWQCMDTNRDYKYLCDIWEGGKAPWKVW